MSFRPYPRSDRFAHELKRVISEIILKEVDTTSLGFVTVSQVKVSRDLKHARVYVSVLNRSSARREIEDFFGQRVGHIRKILGGKVTTKAVPELRFYYDETYEEVERLDRLFADIGKSRSSSK